MNWLSFPFYPIFPSIDYGFFSWPEPAVNSFLEVQDNTLLYEADLTWSQKIPKLFWRGATMVPIRVELMEIAAKYSWGKSIKKNSWKFEVELIHFASFADF